MPPWRFHTGMKPINAACMYKTLLLRDLDRILGPTQRYITTYSKYGIVYSIEHPPGLCRGGGVDVGMHALSLGSNGVDDSLFDVVYGSMMP